jgi:DNA-binding transcriptional regulator YhcF (GntR family)
MRAGDRLPSVRELASEFGVDARTALRACKLLAAEGLIEMRKRSGMYVSLPESLLPPLSGAQESVVDIIVHGLSLGIAPARLADVLRERCNPRQVRVVCIESNADHAAAIGAIIRDTYGVDVITVTVDDVEGDATSALRGANAVVVTTFYASDVLRVTEPLGLPVFIATLDPIQGSEFVRNLENRPVYLIGMDRRWAIRAEQLFEHTPIAPNLHVRIVGEDDLENIPREAQVFVTPAAAPHLRDSAIGQRANTLRYTLSAGASRGLISTIVAANAGETNI